MASTRRVCEEGSALEHALRSIRMGRPASPWGLRRLGGSGGEEVLVGTVVCGGGEQGGKAVEDGGYWKVVELGGKGDEKVVAGARERSVDRARDRLTVP